MCVPATATLFALGRSPLTVGRLSGHHELLTYAVARRNGLKVFGYNAEKVSRFQVLELANVFQVF
jgi:hypothetical protein